MAYFNHAFQKAFIGTSAFNMGTSAPFSQGSASSSGTTITIASTTSLVVGMQVSVTAGTGVFAPGTFVTAILSATTFSVNVAPTTPLSGATVQGVWTSMSQPTGSFTFVDPNTFVTPTLSTSYSGHSTACPLVLASGSVHGQWTGGKDKIGPFHGGYTESIKSKTINPKYVSAFYRVDPCPAQQSQVTVGLTTSTPIVLTGGTSSGTTTITVASTAGLLPGMTIALVSGTGTLATSAGANVIASITSATQFVIGAAPTVNLSSAVLSATTSATAACAQDYLCGETYYLRVDLKGSPALRFLTRNSYYTASAYTGCCPTGALAPSAVNPLIVYVNWAYQLLNSPLIGNFIQVQITYSTDLGVTFAGLGDGTNSKANLDLLLGYIQNPSTLPVNTTAANLTQGGLIINGAYADTRFLDCTFYPNDSIIAFLEPIQVFASEVDLNGDPCAFSGVCINNTCKGVQQKGTGENIIRDVILTQAYSQDPFYNGMDLRIREITNGNDVYGTINRNLQYSRYYIQHNVPRFNNPSGVFDNDQYLLEIVAPASISVTATAAASGTTITVNSTAGLVTGATYNLQVTSGTGAFATGITVSSITNSTQFVASSAPSTAIAVGAVITLVPVMNLNFEAFVTRWLANAGSACTTLTVYNCPAVCATVPVAP